MSWEAMPDELLRTEPGKVGSLGSVKMTPASATGWDVLHQVQLRYGDPSRLLRARWNRDAGRSCGGHELSGTRMSPHGRGQESLSHRSVPNVGLTFVRRDV